MLLKTQQVKPIACWSGQGDNELAVGEDRAVGHRGPLDGWGKTAGLFEDKAGCGVGPRQADLVIGDRADGQAGG